MQRLLPDLKKLQTPFNKMHDPAGRARDRGYVFFELTNLERREIFRAAVRLWITLFLVALSIIDWADLRSAAAASFDALSAANRTRLVTCFIPVFTDLLRSCRFTF